MLTDEKNDVLSLLHGLKRSNNPIGNRRSAIVVC